MTDERRRLGYEEEVSGGDESGQEECELAVGTVEGVDE